MNIPDEAVEAAARAAYDDAFMAHAPDYLPRYDEEDGAVKDSWRKVGRASLEAAAPFIAAVAYEQGRHDRGFERFHGLTEAAPNPYKEEA